MILCILKKLTGLAAVLLVLSFLVFALLCLAPGDPAEKRLTAQGVAVTKEVLDAERERLGLFKPFLVRYGEWLFGVLKGDFGTSFKDGRPVVPKLAAGLQRTAQLAAGSLFLSLALSLPMAVLSAWRKGSAADHIIRLLSFVENSLPNFLISVLLMYLLCIRLRIFPVIAEGGLRGLLLPVISLAIPMTGRFTRQFRAEFITQLAEDYVNGMRMRGVRERYLILNVLHSSLGHLLTVIALQTGTLMGGSVVIENIFRWPGIGKLVMESITARDYPVIMGFVLIMGTIYVVINQLADLCHHALDPRVAL